MKGFWCWLTGHHWYAWDWCYFGERPKLWLRCCKCGIEATRDA